MTVRPGPSRVAAGFVILMAASCSQPSKPTLQVASPLPPPSRSVSQPAAPEKSQVNDDERMVSAAQRALAQLGYPIGPVDGVFGPATRQAVLAFQRDHGLAEDGRITASLVAMLTTLAAQAAKINSTIVAAGDVLLFADGTREIAKGERTVQWDQDAKGGLVAIRPSTAGWPPAARAGLDWAISHALDVAGGSPISWSSTGVEKQFAIVATSALTPREAGLAGNLAESCRHFELRSADRRYPGLACRDKQGEWFFLRTRIRLAHPARVLGPASPATPPHQLPASSP